MDRMADRYYPLCRMAGSFLIGLLLLEQTWAQSSSSPTTHRWGNESLYHMDLGIRGAASCAASGCHGGPRPGVAAEDSLRGSEYSLWLEKDPHAKSWQTMSSAKSVGIMSKLGILQDGEIKNTAAYKNCLACHNTERKISNDKLTPIISEGVGCESCHGPSEPWYSQHYQSQYAKNLAVKRLGLTDSKPLLQRAKMCTTCHVGSKDRDMNHDMIAAGHPALYFDMAVYHEAYPKHWREHTTEATELRPQLWLAGKIAMADAELELIAARAAKTLPISVWPELSNYQCNSCHVSLNGIPKSVAKNDKPLRTARAPVRNWNLGGIELLDEMGYRPNADFEIAKERLRHLLEEPSPNAERTVSFANSVRIQLIEAITLNNKPMLLSWSLKQQMNNSLGLLEAAKEQDSWESASAAYIAIWASQTSRRSEQLDGALRTMRDALLFPIHLQSPDFPKTASSRRLPTLDEWNNALQVASSALKNEERQ